MHLHFLAHTTTTTQTQTSLRAVCLPPMAIYGSITPE